MSYPDSGYCHQERQACSCEKQNYTCDRQNRFCDRRNSIHICGLIGFFAVLLAFAIGLILGAVYYETIFPVLAAIIAFIAAIAAVGFGIWFFARRRSC